MKKTILSLLFLVASIHAFSQQFTIASKGTAARVQFADNDYEGVKIAASNLTNDICSAYDGNLAEGNEAAILVGTIGHSAIIDSLVSAGELNVHDVEGKWESFVMTLCGKNLVVAGSDRRGTIYGIYEISRRIGVSAWAWWADVPVKKQNALKINATRYVKPSPSVKYRGVFINDEDWGMQPWAAKNYEKSLGDIGPKTYERVCELLLRLGANMLAPAMHDCTSAFYTYPESKVVADRLGIIITTSHCEPMLFNNACKAEWDSGRDGEWNYRTNRSTILGKFANRVAEAHQFDNIYTIAMRGVHDEGMRGQTSATERVAVLTDVIKDQRDLLELFTRKPANEIPQIFVPYKETLDVYKAGLKVPDDVTIVWPDDNYGFMKRLSNADEQKRSGGSGVYYHLSYLGTPHDYLWLCTTPPALMYEELMKAYNTGADRYWLLNVGDIKPMELDMQLFLGLAQNVSGYSYDRMNTEQAQMLANWFGTKYTKDFQQILEKYYHLAWIRKPEYMGWDWQWDSAERCRLRDTEFSFQNYNDAQQRLADYQLIASKAKSIMQALPAEAQPSFFELLGFSVMAAEQMNRKFLMAQLNHEMYAEGKYAEANWAADASQAAADSIQALCHTYNTMLNGKWNGMMTVPPGYVSLYQNMPSLSRKEGVVAKAVDLSVKSEKKKLNGCLTLDLKKPSHHSNADIIHGIGYDWDVLQLGNALKEESSFAEYEIGSVTADSIVLHIHCLPFFPIYEGKSNSFSVSLDSSAPVVLENQFEEWSYSWKDQVMKNGFEHIITIPVDRSKSRHTIRLSSVDTGQIIERIVLDWGGLKPSYLGPSL